MAWHRRAQPGDWKSRRARVMRAHNGVCGACGHPGATEVDHVVNVAAGGTHDMDNLAPIHGTAYGENPCPTCGLACHQLKTQRERAAGMAKLRRNRPDEQHPGRTTR